MGYTEKVGRSFPGGDTGELGEDLLWELANILTLGGMEEKRYLHARAMQRQREREAE